MCQALENLIQYFHICDENHLPQKRFYNANLICQSIEVYAHLVYKRDPQFFYFSEDLNELSLEFLLVKKLNLEMI